MPSSIFKQCLLHALAGDVAGDGRVFVLAADLVHFVDIDNAGLGSSHVAVGGLQQLQNDVFDVFADIAGFRQSSRVDNREGHIEHFGQSLR